MIGLMFLGVALLWLILTAYLTIKIPRWCGLENYGRWLLRLVLVPLLLVGPFVDEIVGMRQFRKLCDERTGIIVSPDAIYVKRAIDISSDEVTLPGYWINIKMSKRTYVDLDKNKPFLSYDIFRTSGGRIAGIALLGGWHSCSAEKVDNKHYQKFSELNPYELLRKGRQQ